MSQLPSPFQSSHIDVKEEENNSNSFLMFSNTSNVSSQNHCPGYSSPRFFSPRTRYTSTPVRQRNFKQHQSNSFNQSSNNFRGRGRSSFNKNKYVNFNNRNPHSPLRDSFNSDHADSSNHSRFNKFRSEPPPLKEIPIEKFVVSTMMADPWLLCSSTILKESNADQCTENETTDSSEQMENKSSGIVESFNDSISYISLHDNINISQSPECSVDKNDLIDCQKPLEEETS